MTNETWGQVSFVILNLPISPDRHRLPILHVTSFADRFAQALGGPQTACQLDLSVGHNTHRTRDAGGPVALVAQTE